VTPAYLRKVAPTYIENWPAALVALSMAQTDIPLSLEEARSLGRRNRDFGRWFGGEPPGPIEDLTNRLGEALRRYPEGAFVRLGSRSAKDCTNARLYGLRVRKPETAIGMLADDSRRIAFDLRLALSCCYLPHLFVRRWRRIPRWAEFRCWMKGRNLVGISQYDCHHLGHCSEIAANASHIRAVIEALFEDLRVVCHLDDVVFDVFVEEGAVAGAPLRARLLELNPFFENTDPCLFTWRNGGDFDGSFRFL